MEILRSQLNDEQLAIAKELGNNRLVIAGPGSGKTRLLVHRIGYQLRASSGSAFKVLCLTFTTEAAKELSSRLKPIVPTEDHWRVWAGNFHQFGQHLLASHGHLIGYSRVFEVIDESEASEVLDDALRHLGIRGVDAARLYYSISAFRGRVQKPTLEELAGSAGRFDEILKTYAELKRSNAIMDFDDLIDIPLKLLKNNPHLQAYLSDIYPYVFVDELQDTSLLQLELLKSLFNAGRSVIFGVADEDQVLYEWRDARLATIREFEEHFKAETTFLVLNHRSPEPIVTVANMLIRNNPDRYDKELKSAVMDRTGTVHLHSDRNANAEAAFIAERIAATIENDNRLPREFAILARVNWLLDPLKEALIAAGVPFVHVGDPSIAKSAPARLIKGAVRVAAGHPNSEQRIQRPIEEINSKLGIQALTVEGFLALAQALNHEDLSVFIQRLLDESGLSSAAEGTDIQNQLSVANQVVEAAIRSGVRDLPELMRLLVLEWNRLQSEVLNAQNKVKVMTIHQAKGLEFPTVYIPRVEERLLPYRRKDSYTNVPEERRLLFVAITRAQSEVVMSLSSAPSPFLGEIAECDISQI
ncbi:MAG: ATP-dependent helicase [Chloroflexi bacterium]|nr:ATP-dependent helicase [Chloroflexota bacterium]